MAVSMQDVRRVLDPEEPDYGAMVGLGTDALPHLEVLVRGDDPMLASKAAYAASMLEGDTGEGVVRIAAHSGEPAVRAAAAAAARNLPARSATEVLAELITDDDPSIRKVALASSPEHIE